MDLDRPRRDHDPMGHRVSCPTFVGRVEELEVLAATFDGVAGAAGHRARRRRRRHRQDPAGGGVLRPGPRRGALVATGVCVPGRRRRPALRTGRRDPPGPRRASSARPPRRAPRLRWRRAGSTGPGLGGPSRSSSTRPCPAWPTSWPRPGCSSRSSPCLTRPGRAVDRSCWSSRTCSGRTRPSAELLELPHPQPHRRPGAAHRHLPQRGARPGPPAASLAAASSAATPGSRTLRLEGLGPRRDGRADRRASSASCPTGRWSTRSGPGRRATPFFAEELTAARHSPIALARAPGRDHDPGRGPVRRRRSSCCGWSAAAGAGVDHRLLVAVGLARGRTRSTRALAETVDAQVLVVDAERARATGSATRCSARPCTRRCSRASASVSTARSAEALTADASLGPAEPGPPRGRAGRATGGRPASGPRRRTTSIGGRRGRRSPCGPSRRRSPTSSGPWPRSIAWPRRHRATADRLALLEQAADVAYLGRRRPALGRSGPSGDRPGRRAAPTPATVARCYALLGRNAWAIGDSDGAFDAYRRAAALVPADPPSVELARVLAEEARGLMLMSRFGEAEERCQRGPGRGHRRRRPGRGGPLPLHAGVLPGVRSATTTRASSWCARRSPSPRSWPSPDDLNRAYWQPERAAGRRRAGSRRRGRSCSTAPRSARSSGGCG